MTVFYQQDAFPDNQRTIWNAACATAHTVNDARLLPGQGHSWTARTEVDWLGFIQAHLPSLVSPTPASTATSTPTPLPTATLAPTATPGEVSPTPTPGGLGVFALTMSDQAERPFPVSKLTNDAAWTNPHVKGVVVRTTWARIAPQSGVFYLDWLNEGIRLAGLHNKKLSFLVTAGTRSPKWFCDANPTACVMILEKKGTRRNIALPWHPAFQKEWTTVVKTLGQYDGKVAVFNMGGFGRGAESYFVFDPADVANIDRIARAAGFADGPAAWLVGATWDTNLYARCFVKSTFICVTGSPFPDKRGDDALRALITDSTNKYGRRWGAASHGLTPNAPGPRSIGGNLPGTSHIGFECALPQGANLKATLEHGIAIGAEWIGVYPKDLDQTAVLDAANDQMTK